MTRRARISLSLCCALFFIAHTAGGKLGGQASWWDLRIDLHTSGTYECRESASSYSGQYTFEFQWTGQMERDGEDFIVYSGKASLETWEAGETALGPEGLSSLSTADFTEEPVFDFHYVLNESRTLQLDFHVTGFTVPLHPSLAKVELNLPATRDSADAFKTIEYDPHITRGSNAVRIKTGSIDKLPVEQNFSWTWAFKKWLERQQATIFFTHTHEVDVRVVVTPRFKKTP